MATFEGSDQIVVKPGDYIPITKQDKRILKTLQSNSKDAQQGFDIYQKLYRYIKKLYGEAPIIQDFRLDLVCFNKNSPLGLTKEETMIVAATAYDLFN